MSLLLLLVEIFETARSCPDCVVGRCKAESEEFVKHERKYVDKSYHDPSEPSLAGPQMKELQFTVYEKEKHQRPFECIADRTDGLSRIELETNPNYLSLVSKCKSQQEKTQCNASYSYRTMDGTCNNLLFPTRGSVLHCLRRIMPANYKGVSGFRLSVAGKPLPDPRSLSLGVNNGCITLSKETTQYLIAFGQLLAHDITDTPVTFVGDKPIDCCSHPNKGQHPQCAPILLKEDDPFYSKVGVTCFNFVRSAMCDTCTLNPRIQRNQATTFIDLSILYGVTELQVKQLRANDGTGKLKVQHKAVGDLMPADTYLRPFCGSPEYPEEYCFKSGDRRVNMHTSLMSIQILFLREHNRIASILGELNPHWSEEILYQVSRKINSAQMQAIAYKEFIPLLLGSDAVFRYDLGVRHQEGTSYNSSTDPTLYVEFNAASFRLHPMISGVINKFEVNDKQWLQNKSRNAAPLYHGKMGYTLKGMSLTPSCTFSRMMVDDISEYLYKRLNGTYGFDLMSVNIQRGRDHGLPTYTQMVKFLSNGYINIKCFDDLQVLMKPDNIQVMRNLYENVEDIDLWIGLINEDPQDDMLVGPTAAEINAMQFKNLKYGDRFYFEHWDVFTPAQLQSIRNASLSRITCHNTKIKAIQKNAMLLPSSSNRILLCEDIPLVDLSNWKEPEHLPD